jgi:hypothetical protein
MQNPWWSHLKNVSLLVLAVVAAAGWLYVLYNGKQANSPVQIVKKHFVFYPEYSHGVWREEQCAHADGEGCMGVTYTVPVKGCGLVTFNWHVLPRDDAGAQSFYDGASPRLDEGKYPLYALLSEDSRLIDSPALGTPQPETCQVR